MAGNNVKSSRASQNADSAELDTSRVSYNDYAKNADTQYRTAVSESEKALANFQKNKEGAYEMQSAMFKQLQGFKWPSFAECWKIVNAVEDTKKEEFKLKASVFLTPITEGFTMGWTKLQAAMAEGKSEMTLLGKEFADGGIVKNSIGIATGTAIAVGGINYLDNQNDKNEKTDDTKNDGQAEQSQNDGGEYTPG